MPRSVSIAILLIAFGASSAEAQLVVTSRVTAEQTTTPRPKGSAPDILPLVLLGVEARFTKLTVDVRTYVGPDAVRVEGMGPLMGYPAGLVFIGRPDGSGVWLDPVLRTYFTTTPIGDIPVRALSLSPVIKSKPDGEEVLLGRRTTRTRTEIAITLPEDPGAFRTFHDSMLGQVPIAETDRVGGGQTAAGIPATMNAWVQTKLVRDMKVVVRSWDSKDFGAEGLLAAGATGFATMSQTFGVVPAGLPLKQVVQTSSSNGVGYRWETTVTSVVQETQPPDRFLLPAGYRQVSRPPINLYPK